MNTIKIGSRGADVVTLQKKLNLEPDGIFGPLTNEAVRKFQENNQLVVDGIVGPRTWEMLKMYEKERHINEIIVHCSATPEGNHFDNDDIRQWHLARGFSDIGYHYVVYLDGSIHRGRSEAIAGAHCTGHNSNSIGVCYIGGVAKDGKTPKDTRTDAQKESLLNIIKELKQRYPNAQIRSHKDFANKACPSFDATQEYKNV